MSTNMYYVETKTNLDNVQSDQALQIDFAIKYILKNILKDYIVIGAERENLIKVIKLMLEGEKSPEKMKEAFELLDKMQAEWKTEKDKSEEPDSEKSNSEKPDVKDVYKQNYRNIVMYLLGLFYHYGFSGIQKPSKAVEIYKELVKDQFAPAFFSLGLCLEMDLGCKKNLHYAFFAYSYACEWAEKHAKEKMNSVSYLIGVFQHQYGLCHENRYAYDTSYNVHSNYSLATKYYELASGQKNNETDLPCKKSYPRALRALGLLHVIDNCQGFISPTNKSNYIQGAKFLDQANKAYECFERDHSLEVDLKELKDHQELQCLQLSRASELSQSAETSQALEAQNKLISALSNVDQEILKQKKYNNWGHKEFNETQVSLVERLLRAKVELDPLDVNLCLGKFHYEVGGKVWRKDMDPAVPVLCFFELERCKQLANAGQSPCHALFELGGLSSLKKLVSKGVVKEMENECIKALKIVPETSITKSSPATIIVEYAEIEKYVEDCLTAPKRRFEKRQSRRKS